MAKTDATSERMTFSRQARKHAQTTAPGATGPDMALTARPEPATSRGAAVARAPLPPRRPPSLDGPSAAAGTAINTLADQVDHGWRKADGAIAHLEYAVRHSYGPDVVRAALDAGAGALARHVDHATGDDLEAARLKWRRTLRGVVGADGRSIDESALVALRGDVAGMQARRSSFRETGVVVTGDGKNGYMLKTRKDGLLLRLPRFAGVHILENPERFAAQIDLIRSAYGDIDDDQLLRRAIAVFSEVHERDHRATDLHAIYKPTQKRAETFVNAFRAYRNATSEADRREKEALLQMTLFAEASPEKRLQSFGFDMTVLGRINAIDDFGEDLSDAIQAFEEGRIRDGAASSLWTLLDGVAAVGGIRFGRILEEVARSTKAGRRLSAAVRLARMEANYNRKFPSVNAEAILGPKLWARYDEDSQKYVQGLLNNAKGVVSEEEVRIFLAEAGANGRRGVGATEAQGRKATRFDIAPEHGGGKGKGRLGPRYYDEVLTDQNLKRVFGYFLLPASTPGRKTRIEVKSGAAISEGKQAKKDKLIGKNLEYYDTNELITLRMPYDDISKDLLREKIVAWIQDPKLKGQKYVKGVDIYDDVDGEKVFVRRIQWSPEHLNKMMNDVERALQRQALADRIPTVADFLAGLSARMAVAAEREMPDDT